jgi:hypothetical protein
MSSVSHIFSQVAPATIALFLISAYPAAANAEANSEDGDLTVARGLVCDTPEEVQAFVGLNPDEKADDALASINGRFGTNACSILTTVFRKGAETNTLAIPQGIVRIVQVEIVGVVDGPAIMQLKNPRTQFAPIFEEATGV